MLRPFNFKGWIEENRHLLKPPVGNKQIYVGNKDFIVMEFFYQIEGNILLKIIEEGKIVDIPINEGDIFLLPPRTPHSPQRGPNTIGLVIERYRSEEELDGFSWYCESCNHKLFEAYVMVKDIVKQLPLVMNTFYNSPELCTCSNCGSVMEAPITF
jgi:3-hydroxyanthranilate 3,4-dioxygenase